ncbi:MAG: hypothetical protein IT577_20105 [Verrucomicrobiae bacterium]|nr:hypothetical protein [Verrucomicrobiae bacterium]
MSETPDKKSPLQSLFQGWTDETLAFLVLRVWLAMRAFVTGLEKWAGEAVMKVQKLDEFGLPSAEGAVDTKVKVYGLAHYHGIPEALANSFQNQPLLPPFLMKPYDIVLGPALIVLGIMLLLGIGTRISLFLQGMLYCSLTFGLILIKQDGGVAWLAAHMILIAYALTLAKHNKLAVMAKY